MSDETTNEFPTAQRVVGKFRFGERVATPNALTVLAAACGDEATAQMEIAGLFARHVMGDWGDMDTDDKAMNDAAIANEGDLDRMSRVMSAYTVRGVKVWIVTEADRSSTVLLLPEDY